MGLFLGSLYYSIDLCVCFCASIYSLPLDFPCGSAGKESACNVGDLGLIPELGTFPREEKGHPL